jgi:hypothetical protein
MKLNNLIPQRYRSQIVRQFGSAKLIRQPNGQHELVGGTDADRANAFEWSSLFAHEIVFTHFHREDHAHIAAKTYPCLSEPAQCAARVVGIGAVDQIADQINFQRRVFGKCYC